MSPCSWICWASDLSSASNVFATPEKKKSKARLKTSTSWWRLTIVVRSTERKMDLSWRPTSEAARLASETSDVLTRTPFWRRTSANSTMRASMWL